MSDSIFSKKQEWIIDNLIILLEDARNRIEVLEKRLEIHESTKNYQQWHVLKNEVEEKNQKDE